MTSALIASDHPAASRGSATSAVIARVAGAARSSATSAVLASCAGQARVVNESSRATSLGESVVTSDANESSRANSHRESVVTSHDGNSLGVSVVPPHDANESNCTTSLGQSVAMSNDANTSSTPARVPVTSFSRPTSRVTNSRTAARAYFAGLLSELTS